MLPQQNGFSISKTAVRSMSKIISLKVIHNYALGNLVEFQKRLGGIVQYAGKLCEGSLHIADNLGDFLTVRHGIAAEIYRKVDSIVHVCLFLRS